MYRSRVRLPQVTEQVLAHTSHQWTGLRSWNSDIQTTKRLRQRLWDWPSIILVMLISWAAQAQGVPSGAMERRGASQLLAYAPAASYLPAQVLNAPPAPGDESIRARLKSCLLMGDMACVVDQYLLLKDIGRMPGWLVAFQNAFAETNRRAGECERVARAIHQGLREFGQKPEYIRLIVRGDARKMLAFDEVSHGLMLKTHQVSTNGYHVAVKLGDKIIDAYTGLAGLPFREYLARLHTSPGGRVLDEVIQEL